MEERHVVLLAHGSQDPTWLRPVEDLVAGLQSADSTQRVRLAYLQKAQPDLLQAVRDAAEAGASSVQVLPLFMSSRGHVQKDLPSLARSAQEQTNVAIEILPAIGEMPEFADMLRQVVKRHLRSGVRTCC